LKIRMGGKKETYILNVIDVGKRGEVPHGTETREYLNCVVRVEST